MKQIFKAALMALDKIVAEYGLDYYADKNVFKVREGLQFAIEQDEGELVNLYRELYRIENSNDEIDIQRMLTLKIRIEELESEENE